MPDELRYGSCQLDSGGWTEQVWDVSLPQLVVANNQHLPELFWFVTAVLVSRETVAISLLRKIAIMHTTPLTRDFAAELEVEDL